MDTDTHIMGRSVNFIHMERTIIMKEYETFESSKLDTFIPYGADNWDEEVTPTYTPNYYVQNGMEAFDVMEAFVGELKGVDSFYWCNVVKYILRWQNKNGVQDLKKAKDYLQKLIDKYDN